jgi:hypothetical protein
VELGMALPATYAELTRAALNVETWIRSKSRLFSRKEDEEKKPKKSVSFAKTDEPFSKTAVRLEQVIRGKTPSTLTSRQRRERKPASRRHAFTGMSKWAKA